ncbi:MAG: hypothetical protein R3C10_04335 [Pirellulales bacterium]
MMKKRLRYDGLPEEPGLYLDEENRTATVRGKAKSIRSFRTSEVLWAIYVFVGLPLLLVVTCCVAPTAGGVLPVFIVVSAAAAIACRAVLFPAVNIHGSRSELAIDFTKDYVRIGGKKHRRTDRGVPLAISCRIGRDLAAEKKLAKHKYGPKIAFMYSQSRALSLIVQSPGTNALVPDSPTGGGRVIELATIIGEQEAADFVVVCQLALALTTPGTATPRPAKAKTPINHDI